MSRKQERARHMKLIPCFFEQMLKPGVESTSLGVMIKRIALCSHRAASLLFLCARARHIKINMKNPACASLNKKNTTGDARMLTALNMNKYVLSH